MFWKMAIGLTATVAYCPIESGAQSIFDNGSRGVHSRLARFPVRVRKLVLNAASGAVGLTRILGPCPTYCASALVVSKQGVVA